MAFHLFKRALGLQLLARVMTGCTGVHHLTLILQATPGTLWAILMAVMEVFRLCATEFMAFLHLLSGSFLSGWKMEEVVSNVRKDVFGEAGWLFEECLLGRIVKAGAIMALLTVTGHTFLQLAAQGLPFRPRIGASLVACLVMSACMVAHHGLAKELQLLHGCRLRHGALGMASKVMMLASLVASFGLVNGAVEDVALLGNTLPRTLVVGTLIHAWLISIACLAALLHLYPSSLLRQVLLEKRVNYCLVRSCCYPNQADGADDDAMHGRLLLKVAVSFALELSIV